MSRSARRVLTLIGWLAWVVPQAQALEGDAAAAGGTRLARQSPLTGTARPTLPARSFPVVRPDALLDDRNIEAPRAGSQLPRVFDEEALIERAIQQAIGNRGEVNDRRSTRRTNRASARGSVGDSRTGSTILRSFDTRYVPPQKVPVDPMPVKLRYAPLGW